MLEKFGDLRKLQLPQPGVRVSDPFTEGKGFALRSQRSEKMSWLRFVKPAHAVIHGNDGVNLYIFIPPVCGCHSFSASVSRKAHLGTIEGNFTDVTGRGVPKIKVAYGICTACNATGRLVISENTL